MVQFSKATTDSWDRAFLNGEPICRERAFVLTVNPHLSADRRVMVLETVDGRVMAVVASGLRNTLGLIRRPVSSLDAFRQRLDEAGVTLHGADFVFYFLEADKQSLQGAQTRTTRLLTSDDQAAFTEFQSAVSEQDQEAAYVELDHWVAFGAFDQGRLVSVASAYPWGGVKIADLGVLTLESFRARGYARELVRSISRHVIRAGYEPQYRCQVDNEASVALAKAAGVTLFGKWEIVSQQSTDRAGGPD